MKAIYIILFCLICGFASIAQKQFRFTENINQWPDQVLYKTDVPGGSLWLEKTNFVFDISDKDPHDYSGAHLQGKASELLTINHHVYKVSFTGANMNVVVNPVSRSSDYCNYMVGNDRSKWSGHAYKYEAISYKSLYPNIDMKIYSSGDNLKYDFYIYPQGNPSDIIMKYEGCDKVEIIDGNLVINTLAGKIKELHPVAYQDINGKRKKIFCNYALKENQVTFEFPEDYNNSYKLVIDPELVFSTYTGATSDNWGFSATYDGAGCAYSAGICFNTGYPVSTGAYQVNYAGGEFGGGSYYGCDIAIIKYNAAGTQRLWATYLGGALGEELPHSMICNQNNELIVFGTTGSSDYPVSVNAYDNTFNGGTSFSYDNVIKFSSGTDMYVSRLSYDGTTLMGSTLIGGSANDGFNFRANYNVNMMNGNDSLYFNYADGARGEVTCDEAGNIYVGSCTFSNNFPVTAGSFEPVYYGKQEGVVFKFNNSLSQLLWSSYLGGAMDDAVYSIAVDNLHEVYVCGGSNSVNLPVTPGVFHTIYQGGSSDGFVFHISENGNAILGGTYFGSLLYDQAFFVRTDELRNIYIAGQTKAPGSTLILNAAYNTPNSGQFIAKFPNDLSIPIWSTVFGTGNGKPNISLSAFEVDLCNRIYVSGWGREWAGDWNTIQGTKNMQVTSNAYQPTTDGQDFYLMALSDDASQLEYATFFGEIHPAGSSAYCGHDHVDGGTSRFDKNGRLFQSVCASCGLGCNGFPTSANAWSTNNGGITDSSTWICNNALFSFTFFNDFANADLPVIPPDCYPYTVAFENNNSGTSFLWNFGDGNTSIVTEPIHTYTIPGDYNVSLVVSDTLFCNLSDTAFTAVHVLSEIVDTLPAMNILQGGSVQIGVTPGNSYSYQWIPSNNLSNALISNPWASPDTTTNYLLVVSHGSCSDSLYQTVIVSPVGTPELYANNLNGLFFNVFPNPVNDKCMVRFQNTKKSTIYISLINTVGEIVLSFPEQKYNPGVWSLEIDFDHFKLSSGVYYLKLKDENISEIKKIVVQ